MQAASLAPCHTRTAVQVLWVYCNPQKILLKPLESLSSLAVCQKSVYSSDMDKTAAV